MMMMIILRIYSGFTIAIVAPCWSERLSVVFLLLSASWLRFINQSINHSLIDGLIDSRVGTTFFTRLTMT